MLAENKAVNKKLRKRLILILNEDEEAASDILYNLNKIILRAEQVSVK
jgi:hypothetical protein